MQNSYFELETFGYVRNTPASMSERFQREVANLNNVTSHVVQFANFVFTPNLLHPAVFQKFFLQKPDIFNISSFGENGQRYVLFLL